MIVVLALAGVAAWYFFRRVETHNGVVHFTKDSRAQVLTALRSDSVFTTAAQIAGANLTLKVENIPPAFGSVNGFDAVMAAEGAGGTVVLSADYDGSGPAVLVICSPGQEKTVAVPGSGLAVLTVVPG